MAVAAENFNRNVLSESFLHLPLRLIFRQSHPNFINVRTAYASEIWAQLTKNLLTKSGTEKFRENILTEGEGKYMRLLYELSWLWEMMGIAMAAAVVCVACAALICKAAKKKLSRKVIAVVAAAAFAGAVLAVILIARTPMPL